MNDTTFLLDESMDTLKSIRELQELRENKAEWDKISQVNKAEWDKISQVNKAEWDKISQVSHHFATAFFPRVRTHPGKPGKYCYFTLKIPGHKYTGFSPKILKITGEVNKLVR